MPMSTTPVLEPHHRLRTRHTTVGTLAGRWRDDADLEARSEMFERYFPLARRLAGRYSNPHESRDDLIQVAAIGLLGAIDRYDPGREVAFESFAIPTILGELKRHFRNTGWSAHVPRSGQELAQRVERAARDMAGRLGRAPRVSEIANYLELEIDAVLTGLDAANAHYSVSMDAAAPGADDDAGHTLGDGIGAPDDGYGLVETKLSMAAAMARLPYVERTALRLRIDEGLKQIEIAERMGCSQMQISRLLRQAAARMRAFTDPTLEGPQAG
jgi:RNA polymerase sigma-B factor